MLWWFCRGFYSQALVVSFSFTIVFYSKLWVTDPEAPGKPCPVLAHWLRFSASTRQPKDASNLGENEKDQRSRTLQLPSGKHTKNYGKSPFLMGTSTISVAMFNSKLFVYQRVLFSVDLHVFVRFVPSFCWMNNPYVALNGQSTESSWCWLPTGPRYIHILHGM